MMLVKLVIFFVAEILNEWKFSHLKPTQILSVLKGPFCFPRRGFLFLHKPTGNHYYAVTERNFDEKFN